MDDPPVHLSIASIAAQQQRVQRILRSTRRDFLEGLLSELPRSWVANRYLKQEHRNRFEVHRVHERPQARAVSELHRLVDEDASLYGRYAHVLLLGRADVISDSVRAMRGFGDPEVVAAVLKRLAEERRVFSRTRDRMEDEAAEQRKQREHAFMHFMLELLDRLETRHATTGHGGRR